MADEAKKENENMVTLTIDDKEVTVPKGTSVLLAAKQMGIEIPTFCWHPKLKPVGACRMCYVEVEKRPKLEVSCATECMPEMVVHTQSDKVLQGRKAVLEFALMNHPLDCPTCDKGGECDLQNLTFAHGIDDSRFDFRKYRHVRDKKSTFDDLRIGPEIIRNQNRCILCYKCVRSNKEIFGQYDLGVFQRGNMTEINTFPGQQVDSIYSGNLVEICPVGALTNTDWRYKIRVWKTKQANSICSYCADGCNIKVWYGRGKMHRVTSRCNDDIDEGWICNLGRYGYQAANPGNRLTRPLIKKGDNQVPATWEEALGLIAGKFRTIKDDKGGVCIGGLVSPNLDCDSLYAFSKFFRTALKSNNVDFRTDYKMLPESAGDLYSKVTYLPFRIKDIEKSDLIVVIGSNLIKEHPIVNLRVRKAVTKFGAKLFTVNPYVTQSADVSVDEIVHNRGTMEALLNGVTVSLMEQGLISKNDQLLNLLDPDNTNKAAELSGISVDRINNLARAIFEAKHITIIAGEIVTSSLERNKIAGAIVNISKLAGLLTKGQIGFLSRSANSKGAEKLSVVPFPSEAMIEKLKSAWGSYPECEALAADKMILAASKEEIDAMLIVGLNPLTTYPDGQFVQKGLEKLNFLVAADLYETETTAMADVVLPLSGWAEYGGSFINLEGTNQEFDPALKPCGMALPAYEILNKIAKEMKAPLYESAADLANEYKPLAKAESQNEIGNEFCPVKYIAEESDEEYPYPLFVVDDMHHFGHLTEKSKSLSEFCSEPYVELSPALAEKLEVVEGTQVRVESEVGKVVLPVKISKFIEKNIVLIPRNFSTSEVNKLQMRKRRCDRVKISKMEEE